MGWDPHKPIDEQPDWVYRWAPWAAIALVLVVLGVVLGAMV